MITEGHYKYVYASDREISKLRSLKAIANVPSCKDTYPSVPQAALLGKYIPPLRADWKMAVEYPSNKSDSEKNIIANCKVFIERDDRVLKWSSNFGGSVIGIEKLGSCIAEFDLNFDLLDLSGCSQK
jgi:hypothetical protein